MVKKTKSVFVLLLLSFMIVSFTFVALASEVPAINRAGIYMPEIIAEVSGSGYEIDDISATLGSETLAVTDAHKYSNKTDPTCIYALVDVSSSMRSSFDLIKKNLITLVNTMGSKDRLVLITFGDNVNTVLAGGEKKEDILNVIDKLECNDDTTLLYEALKQAYNKSTISASPFSREYVVIFTDGVDWQQGNATYDEIVKLYQSRMLPIYSACSSVTSKTSIDSFGEISRLSGGSMVIVQNEEAFQSLLDKISDVTIIKLNASSNIADGESKLLAIRIGTSQVECTVPVSHSIPDDIAPVAEEIKYDSNNATFTVTFSEKVKGLSFISSYCITDEKGKEITVTSVNASEPGTLAEIQLADKIKCGSYTFTFNSIRDNSKEENPVSESSVYVYESTGSMNVEPWIIALIAVVAVIVVAVIVLISVKSINKKDTDSLDIPIIEDNEEYEENADDYVANPHFAKGETEPMQYHITSDNSRHVSFIIKTGGSKSQCIDMSIQSSIIIGRSSICDIYIDDAKISRQHFAIENVNDGLNILDLNSTNGTFVNGIRIRSSQCLHSSDKISAGLSDIIIKF